MGPDIIDEISTHHYVNNQLKSMFLNLFFLFKQGDFIDNKYWFRKIVIRLPHSRNIFLKKTPVQQTDLDIGDLYQITKKLTWLVTIIVL